jgi:hypothetical protein
MAGGFLVGLNYYAKPLKTLFAVRYDEINPNEIVSDNTKRTVSFAAVYMFKGSLGACLRAEFFHRLKDSRTNVGWKDDEIRLGAQYLFW